MQTATEQKQTLNCEEIAKAAWHIWQQKVSTGPRPGTLAEGGATASGGQKQADRRSTECRRQAQGLARRSETFSSPEIGLCTQTVIKGTSPVRA